MAKSKINPRYDKPTAKMIASMMKENTGAAMLDSGGAYGRHWQRNQGRDFDSEPEIVLDASWGMGITINLYHWLNQTTKYEPAIDRLLQSWLKDNPDSWGSGVGEFITDYLVDHGVKIGGGYFDCVSSDNTYNHENLLSQDMITTLFSVEESTKIGNVVINEGDYAIISIHGGCDVRGGYTDPRVFRVWMDDYPSFWSMSDASLRCDHCDHYWNTDDAYHWYNEGSCGLGAGVQLDDLTWFDSDSDDVIAWYGRWAYEHDGQIAYDAILDLFGINALIAIDDRTIICPKCGIGKLIPSF